MAQTALGFAKVNLFLEIGERREDGYHEMQMCNLLADLADRVTVDFLDDPLARAVLERTGLPGVRLTVSARQDVQSPLTDLSFLPTDESNLAVQAAQAFFRALSPYQQVADEGTAQAAGLQAATQIPAGISIHLEKAIPAKAGLGGGSADGAAVLLALNRLMKLPMTLETLARVSLPLGADLPYALLGQRPYCSPAWVAGVGEWVEPIDCPQPEFYLVLARPDHGVSTKGAFAAVDAARQKGSLTKPPEQQAILSAWNDPSGNLLAPLLFNRFSALLPLPEVADLSDKLLALGAKNAGMTGSGSAVFGLFTAQTGLQEQAKYAAQQAAAALRHAGYWATTARPIPAFEISHLTK